MLRFKGSVRFIKYKELILVEKLKLDNEQVYHYFSFKNRFLCLHLKKFQKVKPFKSYHTLKFNMSLQEFAQYFCNESNHYRFKGTDLISGDFKEKMSTEDFSLYEEHLIHCQICKKNNHQVSPIRKSRKLSLSEKLQLAVHIGGKELNQSIMRDLNISKETVMVYKRKLRDANFAQIKKPVE